MTFTPAPTGTAALTQRSPPLRGPTTAALQGKAGLPPTPPHPAASHRARPGRAPPGANGDDRDTGRVKGVGAGKLPALTIP